MCDLVGGQFERSRHDQKAFGFLPLGDSCDFSRCNKLTPLTTLHCERTIFVDGEKTLVPSKPAQNALNVVEL
jgi:hypothetical protein